jgi:hypothetical protein
MMWFKRAGSFAAIACVLWAGYRAHIPAVIEDTQLLALPHGEGDSMDRLDRQFQSLTLWLPARATVGYLQPAAGEAYGGLYVAEYALAPRLVVSNTEPEFVIVPPEAVGEGDRRSGALVSEDPRLRGFLLYRTFESGVRIFRRVR